MRNYTASERALIALGAAAGKTADEINEVLKRDAAKNGGTFRPVNASSLGMASRYPTTSPTEASALWDHVLHPKSLGDARRQEEEL